MSAGRQIAAGILGIYRAQQAKVGYILPARVIAAWSDQIGWSVDETEDGIDYGRAEGWFSFAPPLFLTLTDGGFAEMQRSDGASGQPPSQSEL